MADKANPSIKFVSTAYTCVQSASLAVTGADIAYHCAGQIKHIAGPQDVQLTFSLALAATDTATVAAFAQGATGVMEFHPAGDSVGLIQHATTKGTIISVTNASDPGSAIMLDVTARWDSLTTTTA